MAEPKRSTTRRLRLEWIIPIIVISIVIGIGSFTFYYAHGYSYLSNDPAACVNCHVMREQYDDWAKGRHHTVATCNDCHTPHSNIFARYLVKAENGFWHSLKFTTGNFHEPIRIGPRNKKIAEQSCKHCHQSLLARGPLPHADQDIPCLNCHESAGHR